MKLIELTYEPITMTADRFFRYVGSYLKRNPIAGYHTLRMGADMLIFGQTTPTEADVVGSIGVLELAERRLQVTVVFADAAMRQDWQGFIDALERSWPKSREDKLPGVKRLNKRQLEIALEYDRASQDKTAEVTGRTYHGQTYENARRLWLRGKATGQIGDV